MKPLTVEQPWASLMIEGRTPWAFRSWPTEYRGPLLIHAGHTPHLGAYQALSRSPHDPLGCILGVVQLVAVHLITEESLAGYASDLPARVRVGLYAWEVADPRPLRTPRPLASLPHPSTLADWAAEGLR